MYTVELNVFVLHSFSHLCTSATKQMETNHFRRQLCSQSLSGETHLSLVTPAGSLTRPGLCLICRLWDKDGISCQDQRHFPHPRKKGQTFSQGRTQVHSSQSPSLHDQKTISKTCFIYRSLTSTGM